jgi:superfamily I DNA/RNA helicase
MNSKKRDILDFFGPKQVEFVKKAKLSADEAAAPSADEAAAPSADEAAACVIDVRSNDDHLLQGPAGTGKTRKLIGCIRAHPAERFLVLMFNVKVRDSVRQRTETDPNAEVQTLDAVCYRLAFESGAVPDPSDDEVYKHAFTAAWKPGSGTADLMQSIIADIDNAVVERRTSRTHPSLVRSEIILLLGQYIVNYWLEGFDHGQDTAAKRRADVARRWHRNFQGRCRRGIVSTLDAVSSRMAEPLLDIIANRRAWSYCSLRWFCARKQLGRRLPELYGCTVIAVDEAQDLNYWMYCVVQQAGTRRILVGDPNQSIFSFQSANINALTHPNAHSPAVHRISVVHRYGQSVCDLLHRLFNIESSAHPDADTGGQHKTAADGVLSLRAPCVALEEHRADDARLRYQQDQL